MRASILIVFAMLSLPGWSQAHRQADDCEFFIREIRMPMVSSYEYEHLDVILQINTEKLDSHVSQIGFMDRQGRMHNDFVIDRYGDQAKLFIASPSSEPLRGAFYLLTERGTWYWINDQGEAFSNFSFSSDTLEFLKAEAKWRFGFSESYAVIDLTDPDHAGLRELYNPFNCSY